MKNALDPTVFATRSSSSQQGPPRTAFPLLFLGGMALLMAYTIAMTAFNITTLEWAVGSAMAIGLVAAGFARQAATPTVVIASAPPPMSTLLPVDLAHLSPSAVTGGEIG